MRESNQKGKSLRNMVLIEERLFSLLCFVKETQLKRESEISGFGYVVVQICTVLCCCAA
jgi:hypothetical protein